MSDALDIVTRLQRLAESRTKNPNVEADESRCLTQNTVTKSHALSRAYYRFGLVEKRCMEALISKLHPLRLDNNLQEVELSAREYAKAYHVSEKLAYRDIAAAVEALMHRVIVADRANGKAGRIEFTLMAKAEYVEDAGHIICAFNPYIVPYLIGLRAKFSSYPLKTAVNFSSSYTWRFYELLVSWAKDKEETEGRFLGWISKQPVDDLREMLGVPASYAWSKFETQILQTAQAELLKKANIHVRLTRIKTNRKITHLKIEFIQEGSIPPSPESCAAQSTHTRYSVHNPPT